MRKIFLMLFVLALSACHSNYSSTIKENTNNEDLLVLDNRIDFSPQNLTAKEQEYYNQITDAFYEQIIEYNVIKDDSSLCGYYHPRPITRDSIRPFLNCGTYNDSTILTFIINGFYHDPLTRFIVEFSNDDSEVYFAIEKEDKYSELLLPYVYNNGHVTTIKQAYRDNIIDKDFFRKNSLQYDVEIKDVEKILSNIDKDYFANLPSFNADSSLSSPLNVDFENTKRRFYKQEIVDKSHTDDRFIREKYKEQKYKNYYIDIDYSSIHFNCYKELSSNCKLFVLSVNDILFDIQSWFRDPNVHEIKLGDVTYYSMFVIEPIIEIDENIYFLSDAYSKGVLTDSLLDELKNALSHNALVDWYPNGFEQLETKLLERRYQLGEIHKA